MKIKIACVGKLKDAFYLGAAAEYGKRLSRFCALEISEVADENAPESLTEAEARLVLEREGKRLLTRIRDEEYVVCLCIDGVRADSLRFAALLQGALETHPAGVTFVIGGSLGLSEAVRKRGNLLLSLSDLTLPHRLCRVVLLEQIYRAFKINAREPYHK